MFEAFELNDEDLWERPETERLHCVLLILAAMWTQPRVISTQLHSHRQTDTQLSTLLLELSSD